MISMFLGAKHLTCPKCWSRIPSATMRRPLSFQRESLCLRYQAVCTPGDPMLIISHVLWTPPARREIVPQRPASGPAVDTPFAKTAHTCHHASDVIHH